VQREESRQILRKKGQPLLKKEKSRGGGKKENDWRPCLITEKEKRKHYRFGELKVAKLPKGKPGESPGKKRPIPSGFTSVQKGANGRRKKRLYKEEKKKKTKWWRNSASRTGVGRAKVSKSGPINEITKKKAENLGGEGVGCCR